MFLNGWTRVVEIGGFDGRVIIHEKDVSHVVEVWVELFEVEYCFV